MIETLAEISKCFLTPMIAIVTAYVAWQQWQENKLKSKLERYERRLKIYQEILKLLSTVLRDVNLTIIDLRDFRIATAEAHFLFSREIPKYINDIYKHGIGLASACDQYRDCMQEYPPDYDHQKTVKNKGDERDWLLAQFEILPKKFAKYLNISR